MLITAYPVMLWLVRSPSLPRLLAVELWLSCIFGSYNGAMVVFLTEIMPINVRTSGFSLAYSLATAIFGGFTPAISTYLIHVTGNRAVPGLWLSFAAGCGLAAAPLSQPHPPAVVGTLLRDLGGKPPGGKRKRFFRRRGGHRVSTACARP